MSNFKSPFYNGCENKYKNGTRMLIGKGQDCVLSTNYPFWRLPKDTDSKVKTRSILKRKKTASIKYIIDYETLKK